MLVKFLLIWQVLSRWQRKNPDSRERYGIDKTEGGIAGLVIINFMVCSCNVRKQCNKVIRCKMV